MSELDDYAARVVTPSRCVVCSAFRANPAVRALVDADRASARPRSYILLSDFLRDRHGIVASYEVIRRHYARRHVVEESR